MWGTEGRRRLIENRVKEKTEAQRFTQWIGDDLVVIHVHDINPVWALTGV